MKGTLSADKCLTRITPVRVEEAKIVYEKYYVAEYIVHVASDVIDLVFPRHVILIERTGDMFKVRFTMRHKDSLFLPYFSIEPLSRRKVQGDVTNQDILVIVGMLR